MVVVVVVAAVVVVVVVVEDEKFNCREQMSSLVCCIPFGTMEGLEKGEQEEEEVVR